MSFSLPLSTSLPHCQYSLSSPSLSLLSLPHSVANSLSPYSTFSLLSSSPLFSWPLSLRLSFCLPFCLPSSICPLSSYLPLPLPSSTLYISFFSLCILCLFPLSFYLTLYLCVFLTASFQLFASLSVFPTVSPSVSTICTPHCAAISVYSTFSLLSGSPLYS